MKREYLLTDNEVAIIRRELEIAQDSEQDYSRAMQIANIIKKLENGGKGFHYTSKNPLKPLVGAAKA